MTRHALQEGARHCGAICNRDSNRSGGRVVSVCESLSSICLLRDDLRSSRIGSMRWSDMWRGGDGGRFIFLSPLATSLIFVRHNATRDGRGTWRTVLVYWWGQTPRRPDQCDTIDRCFSRDGSNRIRWHAQKISRPLRLSLFINCFFFWAGSFPYSHPYAGPVEHLCPWLMSSSDGFR